MKIIQLIVLGIYILIQPLAVFGSPSLPEPTPVITDTPTPTAIPTEQSPPEETAPTTTSSPSTDSDTGTPLDIGEQVFPTIAEKPKPEELSITPYPDTVTTLPVSESTESATVDDEFSEHIESTPIPPTIETGDAENKVTVENVINTNITGLNNCFIVITHNIDPHEAIDLTDNCEDVIISVEPTDETVNQVNDAHIQTTIMAIAETGKNVVLLPDGTIKTGNASASANLFNLVNTNIAGDNTLFGVINLFDDQQGDIILPYELEYVSMSVPTANEIKKFVEQLNEATVINNVTTLTNTGLNSTERGTIETGEAQSIIQIYDKLNTNLFQSGFLILEINTYGVWEGELIGWWGEIMKSESQLTAFYNNPFSQNFQNNEQKNILQHNKAEITNTIALIADTGNNSASGAAAIQTGHAETKANIVTIANTNITGDNWYHIVINIFDTFKGNIIFPRPDIGITTTADKTTAQQDDEIMITTQFYNKGILWARDTLLTTEIPDGLEFIESSFGGIFEQGKVSWDLGKLAAENFGSVWVKTRAKEASEKPIYTKSYITTSTDEPNQADNMHIIQLFIRLIQSAKNSDTTTSTSSEVTVVKEYIEQTDTAQQLDLQSFLAKNSQNSDLKIYKDRTSHTMYTPERSIWGEQSHQPIKHAQTASPSLLLLFYLFSTIGMVVKSWIED